MPISHKNRLIFIHVPKNAGTSIEKQLDMTDTGHKSWDYYAARYPSEWVKYRSFAVIRNPFDRLLSNYEYAKLEKSYWHSVDGNAVYGKHPDYDVCHNNSFADIINILGRSPDSLHHPGWKPQYIWFCEGKNIKVTNVIKYENLQEELKQLSIVNNLEEINVSKKKGYSEYYTDKLYDKVRYIYQTDFDMFYKDLL